MLTRSIRPVRSILALAGLAASLTAIAAPVMAAGPEKAPAQDQRTAKAALERAAELMADGKIVEARELLMPLVKPNAVGLSDSERGRAANILTNAKKRLDTMNPVDVSLQTAEVAISRDDLVTAQRHIKGVIDAPKATNDQVAQAKAMSERVADRKSALAGTVDDTIASAAADLERGRSELARLSVERLVRSGVALSPAQHDAVTDLQAKVLADEPGFASAGMLQPGVVRRTDSPEATPAPAAEAPTQVAQAAQPSPTAPVASEPPAAATPAAPASTQSTDPMAQARQFEAQNLLTEADKAFDAGQLSTAADRYGRVISAYGTNLDSAQLSHAQSRLAEANRLLSGKIGGAPLQEVIDRQNLVRQQVTAEFENDLAQSEAMLKAGDAQRARELAASAKLRVAAARDAFSTAQLDDFNKRAGDRLAEVAKAEEEIRRAQIKKQTEDIETATRTAAATAVRQKAVKISENIDRCRALQQEQKYEEALQVVDNILFLDPVNPTALLLKDVYSDIIVYRTYTKLSKTKNRNISEMLLQNQEATIPPVDILSYPTDWPKISYMRGAPVAFSESEDNKRILTQVGTRRIPVNFADSPLSDVVSYLTAVTNLPIDVDWPSLQQIGIDKEAPVSLNLTNVKISTVLDRVTEKVSSDPTNGAAWAVNDGVLQIASRETINKNKTLVIYDIRDLLIQIPQFNNAPEFDISQALQSSGGGGGGGGGSSSPFQSSGGGNDIPRRSLEERTQDIISIITQSVDQLGWQDNGGDVGTIQQLRDQGTLIITNTPANHRAIEGLLSKLREVRSMQINVETRFLLVSQSFFEQIGFDLDVYFNGTNNQVRALRAVSPTTNVQPSDFFNFAQGGLQRTVTPPRPGGVGVASTTVSPIVVPRPSPLSVIGAGQNSLGLTESLTNSTFGQQILSQAPALGVAGQFLDDIQVDFLIKATQADRRTVALQAPRLTFMNGQRANISVQTQTTYVSALRPVVSEGAVGFDPVPTADVSGVSLDVEGTISADRRYVTMNIQTGVSTLLELRQSATTAVAGGGLINSATASAFVQLPVKSITSVNTSVTAPDQGTALLGGQRLTTETEVETGVPVLSKIPILNRFFSNRTETREDQTLLILIKPTVLIQNEEEERHFPGLGESVRLPFGG